MEFSIIKVNSKQWDLTTSSGTISMTTKDNIVSHLNKHYTHFNHKQMLKVVNDKLKEPKTAISFSIDQIEMMRLKEIEKKYIKLLKTVKNTKTRHFRTEEQYDKAYNSDNDVVVTNWIKQIKPILKKMYLNQDYDKTLKYIDSSEDYGLDKAKDKLFYTRFLNRLVYYEQLDNPAITMKISKPKPKVMRIKIDKPKPTPSPKPEPIKPIEGCKAMNPLLNFNDIKDTPDYDDILEEIYQDTIKSNPLNYEIDETDEDSLLDKYDGSDINNFKESVLDDKQSSIKNGVDELRELLINNQCDKDQLQGAILFQEEYNKRIYTPSE